MAVTADEFELPLAVAESTGTLAFALGIKPNIVRSHISHNLDGTKKGVKYTSVLVPDDDEEPDDDYKFKEW